MIIFIGPNRQRGNIKKFADFEHVPSFGHRTYNWLFRARKLPSATYIFTFIDRLDASERRLAGKIYRHINKLGEGFRALNDPAKAKNRLQLLQALHETGINDFSAYLALIRPRPARFPVFIRRISQSLKPLTGLLPDQESLDKSINQLEAEGEPLDDLMVIEFCASEIVPGIYQKHSAYRSGDRVSLNYPLYESNWLVKIGEIDIVDHSFYEEEEIALKQNAFAEVLRQVFDIAHIEYGRADFGVVNGRPQIYEINFNPEFRTTNSLSKVPLRKKNVSFAVTRRFEDVTALDSVQKRHQPNLANDELTAFRWRFWRNYAPQRY